MTITVQDMHDILLLCGGRASCAISHLKSIDAVINHEPGALSDALGPRVRNTADLMALLQDSVGFRTSVLDFLRSPECKLFAHNPQLQSFINSDSVDRLMSEGRAGRQTLEVVRGLNEQARQFQFFKDLIRAVRQAVRAGGDVSEDESDGPKSGSRSRSVSPGSRRGRKRDARPASADGRPAGKVTICRMFWAFLYFSVEIQCL